MTSRFAPRLPVLLLLLLIPLGASAQFTYRNFTSAAGITLNGAARKMRDRIRIVPAQVSKTGSVWFNSKQRVADGFESTFSFSVTAPGSRSPRAPGADGIAFVLQNSSVYEGGVGGGIGYEGIRNSLAVEFDTYDNNPDSNPEPNGNHISVHSRGMEPNSADHRTSRGWTSAIPDLKSGGRHTAKVRYVPGTLEIYLDDLDRPVLAVALRLDTLMSLDNGTCWMGFTAATGGSWANFDLFNLTSDVVADLRDIFFDHDKTILKSASFPELKKLVGILKDDPSLLLEIRGHTDNQGTSRYNRALSKKRAEAVRQYLVRSGIAKNRVLARGYGADMPIADNASAAGRAQNRRVEARLYKK